MTGHSGIVPTDSGIVTSDSGHPIKLGTMDRNGWARWTGIAGHDGPESVGTMDRNTQRLEVLNPSGDPRRLHLLRLFRSMVVDSQPEKKNVR